MNSVSNSDVHSSEFIKDNFADNLDARLSALFDDAVFRDVHQRMSPFNLFEAVGATRAELRHSNFLAYLLSPSRPHGLRARPLLSVLRSILERVPTGQRPIMTLELIAGELDDAIVYRERDNIDVLVELPTLNLVVAIENKIGSKAGVGQLQRYTETLKIAFPGYKHLLVFLTPDGDSPNHDDYVAFSYSDLLLVLNGLVSDLFDPAPVETKLIINHYINMVRRHVVQDDELRNLALKLYERHKEAFDFIFDCRPDPQNLLSSLRELVVSSSRLIEDSNSGGSFRFLPSLWVQQLASIKGDPAKWSKTGRGLLFEAKIFSYAPGRVNVALILGPGDAAMRSKVYQAAAAQRKIFSGLVKPMGEQWATIYSRDLLTSAQAKGLSFEDQWAKVELAWRDFEKNTLGPLTDAVLSIDKELAEPRVAG